MCFFKEVMTGVEVRHIECVSDVDGVHFVLVTVAKPCTVNCITDAIRAYNAEKDESGRIEIVPFSGADVVTFSKAQGYMQHSFYAPFEAAKKCEEAGGESSYWFWNSENGGQTMQKRACKQLVSDLVENSVKPAAEKRTSVTPVREVMFGICFFSGML